MGLDDNLPTGQGIANRYGEFGYRDFLVLLAVAETGSFRKAGSRLSLGQSAVSRRVHRLEELLGVSLFERRPGGARLTPAGAGFASRARSVLRDIDSAVEVARSAGVAGNGNLCIGLIASLSCGPLRRLFEQFLSEHSNIELCWTETDRSELYTLLSHRRVDLVIAAGTPSPEVGDGLLFANEPIFLAVASGHAWAKRESLSWSEIRKTRFIVSAQEPGPEIHDYILRRISSLEESAIVRRHRLGREGIMTLVGLGVGVSLVANHWRGVSYPNVTFVRVGDEDETIPFSITWRPENDNPALRRFVSLARVHAKRNASPSGALQTPDPSP